MLGTWVGELLIAGLFVAGYAALGNTPWYIARTPWLKTALSLVLALVLQFMSDRPTADGLYLSLQLFVLMYPILDDQVDLPNYLLRWLVALGFWAFNHRGLLPWQMAVMIGLQVVLAGLVWHWHKPFHYRWWANGLLGVATALVYWAVLPGANIVFRLAHIALFVLMNAFGFVMWSENHRQALERQRLAHDLNYDTLTHVGSLAMYQHDLAAAYNNARGMSAPLAVATMDIDNFKWINDSYGHPVGDQVLVWIAAQLKAYFTDINPAFHVYRTGGEEFSVLLIGCSAQDMTDTAQACLAMIRNSQFQTSGRVTRITLSMGMTNLTDADHTPQDVLRRADKNLYWSKQRGRDCLTVDGVTPQVSDIREITLTYTFYSQPIVDIPSGEVAGNEVRLRHYADGKWQAPKHFLINPESLAGILQEVVEKLDTKQLNMDIPISQLREPAMYQALKKMVAATGVNFTVELTEIKDQVDFIQWAPRYRAAGIHFALATLGQKIDMAQAGQLASMVDLLKYTWDEKQGMQQVETLRKWQRFAADNKLPLILYGLDSAREMQEARQLGIQYGQGYFFGRAVLPRIV